MGARRLRPAVMVGVLAATVLSMGGVPAAAQPSCTGQLVRDTAREVESFGAEVVAPTATSVEQFGLVVIRPEATAPHDACP